MTPRKRFCGRSIRPGGLPRPRRPHAGDERLELHRCLVFRGIRIPTLLLTAHAEAPKAVEALKSGVVDLIEKPYSPQGFWTEFRRHCEDARTRQDHLRLAGIEERAAKLSRRERKVMQLLVDGRNARFISERLGISEKTVDFHRRNLLKKMQVGTVAELGRMVEFPERSRAAAHKFAKDESPARHNDSPRG